MSAKGGKTTFGPGFFDDVGTNPERWVAALRVRLGTDVPSDEVLTDFFEAALHPAAVNANCSKEVVEPLGYARAIDVEDFAGVPEGRNSFWVHKYQNAYYSTPVFLASPAQAIAAEGDDDDAIEAAVTAVARLYGNYIDGHGWTGFGPSPAAIRAALTPTVSP